MHLPKFIAICLVFCAWNISAQLDSIKPNTVLVEKEMFTMGEIPNDFPPRENYKSDAIYKKVVQGYINVYTDKINRDHTIKMGYTVPAINRMEERETPKNKLKP